MKRILFKLLAHAGYVCVFLGLIIVISSLVIALQSRHQDPYSIREAMQPTALQLAAGGAALLLVGLVSAYVAARATKTSMAQNLADSFVEDIIFSLWS